MQGFSPIGNPSAPDLRFTFSSARDRCARPELFPDRSDRSKGTSGAAQAFQRARDEGVHVGVRRIAEALVPGSNQPVSFAGKSAATVAPGMSVWSDPVTLPNWRLRPVLPQK